MKKVIGNTRLLFVCFIVLSLVIVTACGGSSTSSNTSSEGGSEKNDQQTFTLKINFQGPETKTPEESTGYYTSTWFMQEIEKRSEGRIKFTPYYNSALVPLNTLADAVSNGSVDIGSAQFQYYGDILPTGLIANLPYWNEGPEDALHKYRETEVGEIIKKEYADYGLTILMTTANQSYAFMLNKPVQKVEDLQGLLLRQSGGPIAKWYEAIGVTGVDIPFPDLYDGLQRGVIDGTVTTPVALDTNALHEVIDYLIQPSFIGAYLAPLFINTEVWEGIPADLQQIINEVAREAEAKQAEAEAAYYDGVMKKIVDEFGVEIVQISEEEQQRFYESAQVSWDYYASLNDNTAKIVEVLRGLDAK